MSFWEVFGMSHIWLFYAVILCIAPTLLVVAIVTATLARIPPIRHNHKLKRIIMAVTVTITFTGNYLLQTYIYSDIGSSVYFFYATYQSDEEADYSLYAIRSNRMWRASLVPPPLRTEVCISNPYARSFCNLLAPISVPPFAHELTKDMYAYLYMMLLSGLPASVLVYFTMRRLFRPWRKQKRKSKDDLIAQPG